ncbi:hypothetical protein SASPL_108267 [Salvia splendens]|uniref:Small subunit ribosomal protein S21e n=1 Tax=Salvia splendens TaxID=180675 RepID=A0A8X8YHT5_SALSN|nr:hypothetical protein SASPL_108267 [Salvia splendens]
MNVDYAILMGRVLGGFIVFLQCLKNLANMQNEEGQNMDLYIPRKCSATNRLITSKDHASVQINVGHVDESGRYTGQFSTFALCGFIRAQASVFAVLPSTARISFDSLVQKATFKLSIGSVHCSHFANLGDADSALDRLWQKKKVEAQQQ